MSNKITGTVAVLALVLAGFAAFSGGTETVTERVIDRIGVAAGPDHTELQFFRGGLTDGGGVYSTTTTAATDILTAGIMEKNKVIRFLGSSTAAAMTVTLPASTTLSSVLQKPGDHRTWIIENGYTAAATTTTIAAGTGIDLQIDETTGADLVIGINNYAWLDCLKEANTDIVCRVVETIPGD